MGKATDGWCILTTTPGQTLNLAASLNDAGFSVWTPVEVRERRVGRERKVAQARSLGTD